MYKENTAIKDTNGIIIFNIKFSFFPKNCRTPSLFKVTILIKIASKTYVYQQYTSFRCDKLKR